MNSLTAIFDYAKSNSLLRQGRVDRPASPPPNNDRDNNSPDHTAPVTTAGDDEDAKQGVFTNRDTGVPHDQTTDEEAAAARALADVHAASASTGIAAKTGGGGVTNTKSNKTVPLKKRATVKHSPPATSTKQTRVKKPRRAIPVNKDYIPEDEQPSSADVVGGRGGRSNHHPGNRPYWIKILESRYHYRTCQSDSGKTMIAQEIMNYVKNDCGGRFLNLDDKTKRWFVLPDAVVLDKIKQALRDKYVPFWAKNMDIPSVAPGSLSAEDYGAATALTVNQKKSPYDYHRSTKGSAATLHASFDDEVSDKPPPSSAAAAASRDVVNSNAGGNKLDFLLSASRMANIPPTAAIPTYDDILKYKIDTLPAFGRAVGDPRMSFSFPPASYSPAYVPSFGMGMFHSVHDPGLMASLGGGGLTGVSHGFGMGLNSGAPSLGGLSGGLPPPSTGLLNSFAMRSLDLERYLDPSQYGAASRSIDMMRSLTGGGMASIGSLGGLSSIGLSDAALEGGIGGEKGGSGESGESSSPGTSTAGATGRGAGKADWNAMFKKAISDRKKDEPSEGEKEGT